MEQNAKNGTYAGKFHQEIILKSQVNRRLIKYKHYGRDIILDNVDGDVIIQLGWSRRRQQKYSDTRSMLFIRHEPFRFACNLYIHHSLNSRHRLPSLRRKIWNILDSYVGVDFGVGTTVHKCKYQALTFWWSLFSNLHVWPRFCWLIH